jgi:imidazoleglycerol-phosphate dehydratase
MREGKISRDTAETRIKVRVGLDGSGKADLSTGSGFFDHMLHHVARHGLFDVAVRAEGDLHIDAHHTVEDIGICLGKAFAEAIGDAKGIARYGSALVPMDEALAEVALDVSGRPFLVFDASFAASTVGEFDVELVEEFFRAFSTNSRITLHITLRRGYNVHHAIEAIFKAFGRALRVAVTQDAREKGIPSTKGMLET